jgi:hypothetical protein
MDCGPQPAGKWCIERLFETLQDRLVKEMRLAGIDSIAAANQYLQTHFLARWEQRFTVLPRHARNTHRRLGREHRLPEILSARSRVRWPTITPSAGTEIAGGYREKKFVRGCVERR